MSEKVGFIGLGIMGRPQSLNLLKGGYSLWVHARRRESMQPLIDAGATACESPAEVAREADIVFVMVSDTPDVQQVILGPGGVIHGVTRGSVVVDMSTIAPGPTCAMAEELSTRGAEMLDAPVSGGDTGAVAGTLSIMVGGKPEVFQRVNPLFECMGKTIVHVGGHGAGQVAKACNQIVTAVSRVGISEAVVFARRNGVDPARVIEALRGGLAGGKMLELQGKRMLEQDYKPGFKVRLQQKDLRIATETAHRLGVALPATALVAQYLNALVGAGDGELDAAAVGRVVERMNGE